MVSNASVLPDREKPLVTRNFSVRTLAPWALLIALVAFIYARVLIKLVHDWYYIPDFSHGFLIPFFVGYILWRRRAQLRNTPLRPSWAGVIVIVFALLVLLTGIYGADLFLSRISLVFLLVGLIWTFAGIPMLRAVTFPLAVLLLAIPFPAIVFNQITFPLQLLASRVAGVVLPLFGVPVLREGNVIQLPAMQLEVAEACSGIRSLMTLFTVAVVYGYFVEKSAARRWILALASIPIAVAANALRIVGTGLCVQYWNPDKALGFFHEFSGWLMFVISLICLYFTQKLIDLIAGRKVSA